jgi:hypothetical protein
MGWIFATFEYRQALIDELTQSYESENAFHTCVEYKSMPGIVWAVWEQVDKHTGKASRYITCYLIKGKIPNVGYKAMDESMGPCYYSCPLEYLDMVPEPQSKYSEGWRDKVRAHHKPKGQKSFYGWNCDPSDALRGF